ncbi:DNA recombination protein RmuC [Nibricoccus sp. IMCC34717]|uniref:DNA recombination protein RmuC n=1 Tax=Nibricoccus sp. IMCC34717 TaxID=3034021 RepID=UPI00384F4FA5
MLYPILALLLGALIGWLVAAFRQGPVAERLRAKEEEALRLAQELAELRGRAETLLAEGSRLQAELAGERASHAEKVRALTEAHERLTTEFKALSAEALKSNNTAFLELAKSALGQHQQKAESDLAARQLAIEGLVKPLKESLEKVDTKIAEIEKNRENAYGKLGQQLEQLNVAQLRLQGEAAKLSTALRSTTYTGSWGELQLRRVVEMADMLPYCDFGEQQSNDGLRADLVVRLPAGQNIVVDAKAPVQSYRAALEAPDDGARAVLIADHAAKVRGHVDALGNKSYWESFQPAPEFVVLFLPGDHLLSAALQGDPSLLDRAVSKKVLLATPTTLIALLKAASYGWRQESISKNAEEVSRLGRELYDRIVLFAEHLEKVGKGLESAMKGYNSAVGSFESSLLPGGRRFAELGAKGTKTLEAPNPVENNPREIVRKS